VFWMMKIITTMRMATPAISPVRMPLRADCQAFVLGLSAGRIAGADAERLLSIASTTIARRTTPGPPRE
jgi:hypothetical protein